MILELVGKNQLHKYGVFSDTFNKDIIKFKNKLNFNSNISDVHSGIITLEVKTTNCFTYLL